MMNDPVLQTCRETAEKGLEMYLPDSGEPPETLHEAMRFSVLNGGKRLRPTITLATARMFDDQIEAALPASCAIEFIHSYSLVHDDLPSMDDDDYRRGKLSCHKKFDEATAILAGDALQTLAFRVLCEETESDQPVRKLYRELSLAAGSKRLVGGQQLDLEWTGRNGSIDDLKDLHRRKTGGLFLASFRMGALAGGGSERDLDLLTRAAKPVGLAFQIIDDVLDVKGSQHKLGKTTGKDDLDGKLTYPSLIGLDESESLAEEKVEEALDALDAFGSEADPLRTIANFIVERNH